MIGSKDGSELDTHGIGFGLHFLPYFILNMDTDLDVFEDECKTDTSDSNSDSNIYSRYKIMFIYFLYW